MYVASTSTTVKFHSFPDGDLVYNYQPGCKVDGAVRDISWSKDGKWLSLVPRSGLAEIISVSNQLKLMYTIADVEEPSCTAFQNNTKKFIAYGTKNGQVLIYDIKTKKIKTRFPRASSLISHVEFTARDSHLVAGCLNGEIFLYSMLTLGLSATYKIPRSETVNALRTNPSKRNFIIAGSNEGVVAVWDINVNKYKFFVESHKAPVTGVAFSPINSDLIISTGSDRQFCCYDIVSNKCIATVPVSSSMTAVDFSHDGTHFVMANQEGKLCVYDSRRILEPIHSYEAHKSTIKNLAFQKRDIANCSSNLSEDKVEQERRLLDREEVDTNESLGALLKMRPDAGDIPECQEYSTSANPADSFMIAMGLNDVNGLESMKMEGSFLGALGNFGEGDNKWNESARHDDNAGSHISHNTNQFQTSTTDYTGKGKHNVYDMRTLQKQASTSTPNCPAIGSKLDAVMSPIMKTATEIEDKVENILVPLDQLKKITEEVVKKEMSEVVMKEMSEVVKTLSYDLKYQFSNSNTQMRRHYLDMQMSMVKEFIKMENMMNALREDLASNSPMSDNYLLEENIRLKKQIEILEERLSSNGNI